MQEAFNKSSTIEITPVRCASDGGEIVKFRLVRQALLVLMSGVMLVLVCQIADVTHGH